MAELSRYVLVAQQLGFVGPAELAALHTRVQAMLDAGESPDRRALLLQLGAITPEQDAAVIEALGGARDTSVREAAHRGSPPRTERDAAGAPTAANEPQHPPTVQVPDFEPTVPIRAQAEKSPKPTARPPMTPSTAAQGGGEAVPTFAPGRSIAATFGDKDLDLTSTKDSATLFTMSPSEPQSERSRRVQEAGVAPKFDVRNVLGRGGMGEVWRARDRDLRREVAIKTLLRPQDDDVRRRFIEEAQVTGQLEHPNIVPIHEMGLDNSQRPYIVMKCVKGRSLAQVLHALSEGSPSGLFATNPSDTRHSAVRAAVAAQTADDADPAPKPRSEPETPARREGGVAATQHRASKLAKRGRRDSVDPTAPDQENPAQVLTRLLDIYKKVCDAVAYAHSRGVLHRDLKPENIMVGEFGEVLVMDWGLAKILGRNAQANAIDDIVTSDRFEENLEHTVEGTVKGTPAYMAPEQAMGDIGKLDARTDIYALGALLYELLTLKAPYTGTSALRILADVVTGEFEAPGARTPDRYIPRELEAVVMKAMAKKPASRYQSIAALKADIDAYLSGRTLEAADYNAWQLLMKWAARNKPAVAGVAASLLTLIAGIIFTMTLMHERDLAEAREREQQSIDRLNDRQEEQRLARERAQEAIVRQHREEAEGYYADAQTILSRAKPVQFNRASPQSYFLARMPAMLELSRAYLTHPSPPREWATQIAELTLTLQQRAQESGSWALAVHIAQSAGFTGAIDDQERTRRLAEANDVRQKQVDTDRARLLDALRRIGEAEQLDSERGGLAPGELEERARQTVSVPSSHVVVTDIIHLLAKDNARLATLHGGVPGAWAPYTTNVGDDDRDSDGIADGSDEADSEADATDAPEGNSNHENPGEGDASVSPFDRRLSQRERFMLVQALGHAGDIESTYLDLTAATLTVRVLTDASLLLPVDETVAWVWTAARLQGQHARSVGDWDALVANARKRHGPASPVGVALEQVTTYLELVRDGAALPRPSRNPVLFDTLVRQLGDWVATSAQSGSTYTAELLALSDRDAVLLDGIASEPLTARQQAFVLAQLGLRNDLLPPNINRPEQNARSVLRDALESPTDAALEDDAPGALDRERAEAATMALARIGDDEIVHTLYHRRVKAGEGSQFFRATRLPFRLLSLDTWPDPTDAQTFMDRGRARYMKGELIAAIEDFAMVIRLESQSGGLRPGTQGLATRAFQYRGMALEAMGDLKKSLAAYRQATRLYPTWREGYQLTGALLLKLGEIDDAIDQLKACLAIAPRDVLALIALGDAYAARGDSFAALAAYARAIAQHDQRTAVALVKRARVAIRFNDLGVAKSDADRAIEIDPMLAEAYIVRATVFVARAEPEKALADISTALAINPNNAEAYVMRGRILADQDDHDAALADFSRAQRVDPNNVEAHVHSGDVHLLKLEDVAAAIEHYNRAIELNPAAWREWFNLGVALVLSGKRADGQECLEWALSLCPPWKRGEFERTWRNVLGSAPPARKLRSAADPSSLEALPERPGNGSYGGAIEDGDGRLREGEGPLADRIWIRVKKHGRLRVKLRSDDFDALLFVFRVSDGRMVYVNNEEAQDDGVYDAAIDMEVEEGGEFVIVITTSQPNEKGSYVVEIDNE